VARTKTVYLLHFETPYRHARHYLGSTSDLEARVTAHLQGAGNPLVRAAVNAGINVTLARTWDFQKLTGRQWERQFKRQKNAARLCPLCQSENTRQKRPDGAFALQTSDKVSPSAQGEPKTNSEESGS
jgi:predicted GIY-YIG superfamily endonuclease